jgi:hypothetical protein
MIEKIDNGKLNVIISGLIYPFTIMHYFWRALEKRTDINLYVLGPFFNNWTPWNYGIYLDQKYVKWPDFPMSPELGLQHAIPFAFASVGINFKPDVWIQFDADWHFLDRPNADIVVLVETDPHCVNYVVPRAYSDFSFCMQRPYMQGKETYLPYAYDPDIHYPMPEVDKIYDVCLIGLQYAHRVGVLNSLRDHGVKVFAEIGHVYDEYRLINNQSKIGFNWSSLLDMNARVWELAAMGVCAVENTVPDMPTFLVPGEHYIEFTDATDAEKQIVMALADDDRRDSIAQAAYRKITSGKNTYADRCQQIFETIRIM